MNTIIQHKKKNNITQILATRLTIFLLSIIFIACEKEKAVVLDPNLNGIVRELTPRDSLGEWIYQTFTKPYNISVDYQYDAPNYPYYQNANYEAVQLHRVKPFLVSFNKSFIEVFNQVSGSRSFIQQYSPKNFVLVGSSYVAAGTAEGYGRITVFNLNNAEVGMGLIYHEVMHSLNARKGLPPYFREISLAAYREAGWEQRLTANDEGFVTNYASRSASEDIAEVFSMFITSRTSFDTLLKNPKGGSIIKQKADALTLFLSQEYGINLEQLRLQYEKSLL